MTVETNANFISDFNKAYPRNRDLIKEGDDHIRLVKAVLQNTFPGMDKAITADSDKLNKLDTCLTFDGSTLQINNNIEVAEKKEVDFGGNVLNNIGDPEEPTDAVNLRSLQGSLMWPVGSIYMSIDARNPKDILGFGVWEKYAQGRVIVGSGTTVDGNNETRTVANEAKGGNYQAKLTADNLPEHKHVLGEKAVTAEGGDHDHDVDLRVHSYAFTNDNIWTAPLGQIAGESSRFQTTDGARTKKQGAHSHKMSGETDAVGKGSFFEVIPPFMACNIWVRKADPAP
ncbi:MAG: phage baseplate protein [Bacteroidales bacterium]